MELLLYRREEMIQLSVDVLFGEPEIPAHLAKRLQLCLSNLSSIYSIVRRAAATALCPLLVGGIGIM